MGRMLWTPSEERIRSTNMYRFMQQINTRYHKSFTQYAELYQWSVEHRDEFWAALWDFVEVRASRHWERVVDPEAPMPGARWFEGARLNFAQNLLRFRDRKVALVFRGEDRVVRRVTYAELSHEVARLAASLKALGLQPGERVVGYLPNMPEAVFAMLAATSLGAIWSSCSPDFGLKGVITRFGQIKPRVLFAAEGYWFKGKRIDCLERLGAILKELPSVEQVVIVPYTGETEGLDLPPQALSYRDFIAPAITCELEFTPLPFDHPLYIMYSSGTTGLPKCMVQGAGGILLQQLKELVLHTDLKRDDTIFYFTTCGWMMWNWLVCSLAVGATVVLYDGNPFYPDPSALWQMAQDEGITVFGTSAGYITALEASGLKPGRQFDLSALRAVLSTGSPLSEDNFDFVYREIKADLQLASISGGSDINGCFALGNPMGPVYSGELQCRGLGMAVEAFDENGRPVRNRQGELVCTAPAPSMPLYFWNDDEHRRYREAYFDVFPNVWRHGDFTSINDHGGVIIYGRSDATLNPGGVRIGTAEIYAQTALIPEVADSIVVSQDWDNDVRVILFVKMAPGYELTPWIEDRIRQAIRTNASPRHVPAKIIPVKDIPYTLNMKKVELAVKKIINNQPVLNRDALSNPEALDYFVDLPQLKTA